MELVHTGGYADALNGPEALSWQAIKQCGELPAVFGMNSQFKSLAAIRSNLRRRIEHAVLNCTPVKQAEESVQEIGNFRRGPEVDGAVQASTK